MTSYLQRDWEILFLLLDMPNKWLKTILNLVLLSWINLLCYKDQIIKMTNAKIMGGGGAGEGGGEKEGKK